MASFTTDSNLCRVDDARSVGGHGSFAPSREKSRLRTVVKPEVRDFARATGQFAKTRRAWRATCWRDFGEPIKPGESASGTRRPQARKNTKSALTTCMRKAPDYRQRHVPQQNVLANTKAGKSSPLMNELA